MTEINEEYLNNILFEANPVFDEGETITSIIVKALRTDKHKYLIDILNKKIKANDALYLSEIFYLLVDYDIDLTPQSINNMLKNETFIQNVFDSSSDVLTILFNHIDFDDKLFQIIKTIINMKNAEFNYKLFVYMLKNDYYCKYIKNIYKSHSKTINEHFDDFYEYLYNYSELNSINYIITDIFKNIITIRPPNKLNKHAVCLLSVSYKYNSNIKYKNEIELYDNVENILKMAENDDVMLPKVILSISVIKVIYKNINISILEILKKYKDKIVIKDKYDINRIVTMLLIFYSLNSINVFTDFKDCESNCENLNSCIEENKHLIAIANSKTTCTNNTYYLYNMCYITKEIKNYEVMLTILLDNIDKISEEKVYNNGFFQILRYNL